MAWHPWSGEWHLDAGVLLLALAIDLALPEPPNALHPVAWMGRAISALERLAIGRGKTAAFLIGLGMAVALPAAFGGAAWLAMLGLRELGAVPYMIGGALLLKTTFAVRGLAHAAQDTQRSLESGDMRQARGSLRSLVSRDAAALSTPLAAAAAIESVAENTADSYIAPWLAFALFGLPGAFAYRALNTLDSMIGYHGKYEYIGKASARLDDAANLLPARVSAMLLIAAGTLSGMPALRGLQTALTARRLTASPNAGWTIGAMAGLLGVELEKPSHYRIGNGFPQPSAADIGAAVRLAYIVAGLGALLALAMLALIGVAFA